MKLDHIAEVSVSEFTAFGALIAAILFVGSVAVVSVLA
jgi:hypothetical protein